MKKFNPEQELSKIQNRNISKNKNSQIKGSFIPALVLACFGVSVLGASISNSLTVEETDKYTVSVDIINGQQSQYIKKVPAGEFKATIDNDATFGSITCTKGYLSYDAETGEIYSNNIKEDTKCVLAFMEDGTKKIQLSQLSTENDNTGRTYIFKGDAKNNYIKINNIMFRIVRINGDGTYRLITDQPIAYTTYGTTNNYEESNVKSIINTWLEDSKIKTVTSDYDFDNYQAFYLDSLLNFNGYSLAKVGLLNVREAYKVTDGIKDSYLNGSYFLANPNGLTNVWAVVDGNITNVDSNTTLGVRPVINIEISKLKGQGIEELPYEIG